MTDTARLAEQLISLGIVPSGAEDDIARLARTTADDSSFVTGLVESSHLTPFQAGQVLRGRAHHLTVGRYVLLDRLGRGGMGQVLRARHRHLDRQVAVKIVRRDRQKCRHTMRRVQREARLAARMNHVNVVHVLDAGEVRGTNYLALELVPGPDLGRVVRADGPLDPSHACEYARQAALGLDHIHRNGVVHRDVKPENLGLANGERVVKVLDLGLAASAGKRRVRLGASGRPKCVGSMDFVAPEQVAEPGWADPRSDIYSLGATLYFLLTGDVPFPGGESLDKAKRHLTESPVPVEELRPGLPTGLGELVRRLMARNKSQRVSSAAEAAAELGRFAAPITVPVWEATAHAVGVPTTMGISTMSEPV